jgi:dTDP-4-dehydrorhamnose reductase
LPTILITGATGLLGVNLVARCLGQWDVIGVSHTRRLASGIDGLTPVAIDLAEEGAVSRLVAETSPDLIVNGAAATNVDACEADPTMAARLNVETARQVARAAAAFGVRLVHVSTDAVYGGPGSWHTESEPIDARSVYARTKAAAEQVVLASAPESVVARVNFFGLGAAPGGLAGWALGELRQGHRINGFADVFFSPLLANDLADALLMLGSGSAEGIINVGGEDRLSKFEFARAIATEWGVDPDLVTPTSIDDVEFAAPRPRDSSMDITKARALGLPTRGARAGIARMHELDAEGYAEKLSALIER